jgi:hypothetical protein
MGMGKSLSILALVTKTLDAAQAWQQGSDDDLTGLGTERISEFTRSRATLVLVPSACMFGSHYAILFRGHSTNRHNSAAARMANRDSKASASQTGKDSFMLTGL